MKQLIRVLIFLILFVFGSSTIFACSCIRDSLSKRFKKAKAVFIGQVAQSVPDDDSLIQGNGTEVLQVFKSWKGVKKEFVSVNLNFPEKDAGMCFDFSRFAENKKYLVFAYGKMLKVETVCSDTFEVSDNPETKGYYIVQDSLKKLSNF